MITTEKSRIYTNENEMYADGKLLAFESGQEVYFGYKPAGKYPAEWWFSTNRTDISMGSLVNWFSRSRLRNIYADESDEGIFNILAANADLMKGRHI